VVATPTDLAALCNAQCDRRERCHRDAGADPDIEACRASCSEPPSPLMQHARADLVRALADCTAALECRAIDDICTARAVEAIGIDVDAAIRARDVQTCLGKQETCSGTAGAFSDDLCGALVFLVQPVRTQADACFDRSCDAIAECLSPIFAD
jgi:hypothetical protein